MHKTTLIIATVTWAILAAGATGCKSRQENREPAPAAPQPEGLRAILLDGREAYNADELDRAVTLFKKAADLAPTSAEPLVDLGRTLVRQGSKDKALVVLSRAAALGPGDAFALLNLGHLLTVMGDKGPGLDHLRRAAELKPKHHAILCGLVLALKNADLAHELAGARKEAEAAGASCPDGKDPFATYGDVKPPK